jgi:hypothetical protein
MDEPRNGFWLLSHLDSSLLGIAEGIMCEVRGVLGAPFMRLDCESLHFRFEKTPCLNSVVPNYAFCFALEFVVVDCGVLVSAVLDDLMCESGSEPLHTFLFELDSFDPGFFEKVGGVLKDAWGREVEVFDKGKLDEWLGGG